MTAKKTASGLVSFFTKPKRFVAGAILGLVVATVVVTRFFLPAKEVVHEVETLSPSDKLTVTLDQPYVISNTPDMSKSGVLEERNNIFNNIDVSDVDAFQRQCVERSEQEVVDGGLYNEARANAEANLKAMFAAALGDQIELTVVFREA